MFTSLNGLSALLQAEAQQVAPSAQQYVDANSTSVEAVFVGFVTKEGLVPKQPEQPTSNGNASWDKCAFVLTNVTDGIPAGCDTYCINPDAPDCGALATGWVEANPRCKAFFRGQANANLPEGGTAAVFAEEENDVEEEEGGEAEAEAPKADAAGAAEKPQPQQKKRAPFAPKDRTNERKFTLPIYNGQYVEINSFDRSRVAGLEAGDLVRVTGFGVSVSVYWKEKSKRFASSAFGPTVGFNFNLKGVTRIRQLEDVTEVFDKIKAFRFLEKSAPVADVFFNVAEEGAQEADVRVIRDVEIPQDVLIVYHSEVDEELPQGGPYDRIYAEALPIENVTDFFRDKDDKKKTEDGAQRRANVELEEPCYPRCTVQMGAVRYSTKSELTPIKQLERGETRVINVLANIRMSDTIRQFGLSRVSQWGRIAESVLPMFKLYIFGRFNQRLTVNNPSNQGVPVSQFSAGVRVFDAKYVASNMHTALGQMGFSVDEPWFSKHFEAMKGPRGGIKLSTLYPYIPNYMHNSRAHTEQDIRMLPVWCLSNYKGDADEFVMNPQDWDLRVLTSTWYSSKDKFSAEGLKDQVRLLGEIGRMSTKEAVACLNRTPDARVKVDPTAVYVVYARRRYAGRDAGGKPAAAVRDEEDIDDDDDEDDEEEI